MPFTLPRDIYEDLATALGDRQTANRLAGAIERSVADVARSANELIAQKKSHIKIELKDELRNELVTRELFDERFKALQSDIDARFAIVDERFKTLESKVDERFNVVDERFKSLQSDMNARFAMVDERFKRSDLKLNIIIALAVLGFTVFNPGFIRVVLQLVQ